MMYKVQHHASLMAEPASLPHRAPVEAWGVLLYLAGVSVALRGAGGACWGIPGEVPPYV